MLYLRICAACLGDAAAPGIDALEAALKAPSRRHRVHLQAISCKDGCKSPATLWLQAEDGASYVFEGIDPIADKADILATVDTYLASPDGWIEDARPCGRLRFCLAARLPI